MNILFNNPFYLSTLYIVKLYNFSPPRPSLYRIICGYLQLNEDSETAITLHEALQSQCDDFSLAATSQTGTNVTSSDARDSGVQSEVNK